MSKLELPIYEKWRHYEAAAIHGGVRFMHAQFCIVSDRATCAQRDEQHRPHCETGPARAWRDGWSLHFWHGTRVPAHWIEERAMLSAAEVLRHDNVEVRRAGCEILGWTRILEQLRARVLDEDRDASIGTLLSVDLPDAPDSRFLRVLCGTGRMFALPVPRECKTALEANSWTYGLDPQVYRKLEVRT